MGKGGGFKARRKQTGLTRTNGNACQGGSECEIGYQMAKKEARTGRQKNNWQKKKRKNPCRGQHHPWPRIGKSSQKTKGGGGGKGYFQ